MAEIIDVRDLEDRDVELLEMLAERLRERARSKETAEEATREDVLEATFGGWADTVNCEELKRNIYESRLAASRPEIKL